MIFTPIILLVVILAIIIGLSTYNVIHTAKLIKIGRTQTAATSAFQHRVTNPQIRMLIIGDSSAVGVGAAPPEGSVAGRLAADFPAADIQNIAVSGSKVVDAIKQLKRVPAKARYDLILIQIGGNDIVRRTPYRQLQRDLPILFKLAKQHSDKIVQLTCGNVGTSQLLPLGTRWFFTLRTKKIRDIFMSAATAHNVHYVDLYRPKAQDAYAKNPKLYYSPDFFHPSATGYGEWYTSIKPIINQLLGAR